MKFHENLFSSYRVITSAQTDVANIVAHFFYFSLEWAEKQKFRETNINTRGYVK